MCTFFRLYYTVGARHIYIYIRRVLKSNILPPFLLSSSPLLQMEADIAQQNRKQASIRQETYILKKSANELKDQIANLSISLRELQATERQLSKEIVDSPDRIKFDLETAHQRLETVKKLIETKEMERKLIQLKVQNAMTAEGDTRRVMHLMDEMETKIQEYEVVVEDLDDTQRRFESAERTLEERRKEKEVQEKKLQVVGKFSCASKNIIIPSSSISFVPFNTLFYYVCSVY